MYIAVDPNNPTPIYLQIVRQVKNAAATGLLSAGDRLPSVRELSQELGINPNTIARAFQELEREGVIDTVRGVGTFVSQKGYRLSERERRERMENIFKELLTEAYHLQYTREELKELLDRYLQSWRAGREENKP
jgi:GntR family transcriptional regulator